MEYIDAGYACDDCLVAIANDDYMGMDDTQEEATRSGLERIGHHLVIGDEAGFCHSRCKCRCLECRRTVHIDDLDDAGLCEDCGTAFEDYRFVRKGEND